MKAAAQVRSLDPGHPFKSHLNAVCPEDFGARFASAAADHASGGSNGDDKAAKAEVHAGPSCSSSSKTEGDSKSRFFDDSEESEGEGEDEEEKDEGSEEVRGTESDCRIGQHSRTTC